MGTSAIGMGSLTAQSGVQQARDQQLLQQLQEQRAGTDDARINKSAKDFEAMLLGTWLRQAEDSFATVPGADDDEDTTGKDQMMSLGVQSLAESMAASGGIGIAKMIAGALHRQAEKASTPAPGSPQAEKGGTF
jgi:Rod binding domain-containing protein